MTERYPEDAALLGLTTDPDTGIEYIPTGQSPYVLHFRRMLQRLLLATTRANDFRVYADGDATIGVRAGRGTINSNAVDFAGAAGVALDLNDTHWLWLDAAGQAQHATGGLPDDRSTFLPLARVVVGTERIGSITDLRGEAMFTTPGLAAQGLTATADEINQALDGINASVDSAALNTLTAGPGSTADSEHRHVQSVQNVDGASTFGVINTSADAAAQVALALSLPNVLPDDLLVFQDRTHGFIRQRYNGKSLTPLGMLPMVWLHSDELTASVNGELLGVVPCDGQIVAAHVSVGSNIESTTGSDGVSVSLTVNGNALTTSDAVLTSDDGAGFRSTAQGDGAAATLVANGTEHVTRGDLVTLSCTRTAAGSVSQEAEGVAVLVILRVSLPE